MAEVVLTGVYEGRKQRAERLGYTVPGWYIEDYFKDAINYHGWESIPIWGPKGGYKSCLELQLAYLVYKDWNDVLNHMVYDALDFIRITETDKRIPLMVADDISSWLPKSLYFTNRRLWSELKKNWDLFRSQLSVFIYSAPLKEKIASFIIDDASGEIFCGKAVQGKPYNIFDCQRWMWSLDFDNAKKSKFEMIRVEQSTFPMNPEAAKTYNREDGPPLPGVPYDIFKQYWDQRLIRAQAAKRRLHELLRQLADEIEEKQVDKTEISKAAQALGRRSHVRDVKR